MFIYNVTIKVELEIADNWLSWMLSKHIPDVINTGYFSDYKVVKVLVDEDDGVTYSIQYRMASLADFDAYQKNAALKLQKEHSEKFADKFVAFRTLLEEIA